MKYYKVELVSIEGGRDVLQSYERKTKGAAINLAIKLSKHYNAQGINSGGWKSQESVWIEVENGYDTIEHYQFVNGVQVYYSSNF